MAKPEEKQPLPVIEADEAVARHYGVKRVENPDLELIRRAEVVACKGDPVYGFERHYWIKDKRGKVRKVGKAKRAQLKVLAAVKFMRDSGMPVRIVIAKSRKQGVSTVIAKDALEEVIGAEKDALIVSHNKKSAWVLFSIYRRFYSNYDLPKPEPYSGKMNLREMSFTKHDGHIAVDTANNVYAGTSETPQYIHCSETSKWEHGPETLTSLNQSIGDEPGTTFIHESTFNGVEDTFLPIWRAAYDNCKVTFEEIDTYAGRRLKVGFKVTNPDLWNGYLPIFISVLEDESAFLKFDSDEDKLRFEGTLDKYEQSVRRQTDCSLEFLHWRRRKLLHSCRNQLAVLKQEWPVCVTAETRVSTERGIIPISEAGGCLTSECGRIASWGPQPKSPIWKLTTRCGRTLRGTFDHPVMTFSQGWRKLSQLEPGQKIKLLAPMFATHEYALEWNDFPGCSSRIPITEDMGYFIGFFMGDGCWHNGVASITCDKKDQDVVNFIGGLFGRVFGVEPKARVKTVGCIEIRAGLTAIRPHFSRLDLIHGGDNAYKRKVCVPEVIWRSPKDVVAAFLSALFECDGSASAGKVRFGSCKEQFVNDIQSLLLGFGINCEIKKSTKPAQSGKYQYSFWSIDLGLEGARTFHDEIGFVGQRKRCLCPKERGKSTPPWFNNQVDEVVSVVQDGVEETFDFTIEPSHVFSANGIYTHNTESEAIIASGRPRFNIEQLDTMPVEEGMVGRLERGEDWDAKIVFRPDSGENLTIFRKPVPGHTYLIGCDTGEDSDVDTADAEGEAELNERLDKTVFNVFDLDGGNEQAANYRAIHKPEEIGPRLHLLAIYYNSAFVVPEANSTGYVTCLYMKEHYDESLLYHRDDWDASKTRQVRAVGHKTMASNRDIVIGYLADAINDNDIVLHSRVTVEECKSFVIRRRKHSLTEKAQAAVGKHDDEVMSSALALAGKRVAVRMFEMKKAQERAPQGMLAARHLERRVMDLQKRGMSSVTGY